VRGVAQGRRGRSVALSKGLATMLGPRRWPTGVPRGSGRAAHGLCRIHPPSQTATFTERLPEPLQQSVNFCPDASKVGTVKIKTPILPNPIEGAVYLASQNANPFGNLIAMYIVAEDPVSGVLIKLVGETGLDPSTGQLTTSFNDNPQLPFSDLKLYFFGGERAPLATPAHCGTYTTQALLAPWSEPLAILADSSTFNITTGPNGGPCPSPPPFTPTLAAGMININAGAFSPFVLKLKRNDGEQEIGGLNLTMPQGSRRSWQGSRIALRR
jgi:hypothetical protein